jgi:phosphatidylglycerophosphate synthase
MSVSDKNGNKLPPEYDDPVDIFYKKYIDILNPYFKNIGFTPNGITTISLLFGLFACYLYYKKSYILSGVFFIISYFFDTMDGYYARIYNMQSKFGSYYDVVSDWIVILILLYLFITNKHIIKSKINIKLIIIFFIIILVLVDSYHMSCQEDYTKVTNKEYVSDGLSFLDTIKCKNHNNMIYTRYFGPGVLNLVIGILLISHFIFCK